jgi:3-oxoacyl-[acyl-carrier protein] reductase
VWSYEDPFPAVVQIKGHVAFYPIGSPDDVADLIASLASDSARWITGASILVDGGLRL